jgi:hypothetical protein
MHDLEFIVLAFLGPFWEVLRCIIVRIVTYFLDTGLV